MPFTNEQLKDRLVQDEEFREGLQEFIPLSSFLRDCILKSGYRYPDQISENLVFTDEGTGGSGTERNRFG